MYPDWVLKQKKPGTTIKRIGNNYYLYYAASHREEGRKHPVSVQTYIGKITVNGVVSERVSISVRDTEARTLSEIIPDIPAGFASLIAIRVRNDWLLTKTDKETLEKLEREGVCRNGKVIL